MLRQRSRMDTPLINNIFDDCGRFAKSTIDMATTSDVFFCVFQLLMQRQAEVFGDNPPDNITKALTKEINAMCSTYTFFEVAVLYELSNWLRENQYPWRCSEAMKNSLSMFLLGITDEMPDMQKQRPLGSGPWEMEPPVFAITVEDGAFDQIEKLMEDHWFTLLWERHYKVDRNSKTEASFGHIMIAKEEEPDVFE